MSLPLQGAGGATPPAADGERSGPEVSVSGAATEDGEEAQSRRPEPRLCGICNAEIGKYKCPRCSVA